MMGAELNGKNGVKNERVRWLRDRGGEIPVDCFPPYLSKDAAGWILI